VNIWKLGKLLLLVRLHVEAQEEIDAMIAGGAVLWTPSVHEVRRDNHGEREI
jgi:hypothetical protein